MYCEVCPGCNHVVTPKDMSTIIISGEHDVICANCKNTKVGETVPSNWIINNPGGRIHIF